MKSHRSIGLFAFASRQPSLPRCFVVALLLISPLLPARASSAAQLRGVRSAHYLIRTDLDAELTGDLARRMDAMYDEYSHRFASFKSTSPAPRLEVYLLQRQEDYLRLTADRLKNTGGVYIPRRNLLAAFLEGQGRDGLRRTLQHEAFHQFAYNELSQNLPIWLNEGLAQMFEEGIWNGRRFQLAQVPPRRLRQLQADVKNHRLLEVKALMGMTPEQWALNLMNDHDLGATPGQCQRFRRQGALPRPAGRVASPHA
jgi:hypothetical protein